MMQKKAAILTLVTACTLGATFAAYDAGAADPTAATSGAGASLTPADVVRKIEAAGYKDVRDVEYDDGRWEADATSPQGARVDVVIDPASGAVVVDPD